MECLELKTEIKECCICKKYIEKTCQLTIINHNHYHISCLDRLWLQITKKDRYKILDNIVQHEMKIKIMRDIFDES